MGRSDLMESLRKRGEEQLAAIEGESEKHREQMRLEQTRILDEERSQYLQAQHRRVSVLCEGILQQSRREAAMLRLKGQDELAQRLQGIARRLLPRLRQRDYEQAFQGLCKEIPAGTWSRIHVHPLDVSLARQAFAESEILGDESITGGLIAKGPQGRVRILNTLDKRLELAWETLLPLLVEDIWKREDGDGMA